MIGDLVTCCYAAPSMCNQLIAPRVWEVAPMGPFREASDFSPLGMTHSALWPTEALKMI